MTIKSPFLLKLYAKIIALFREAKKFIKPSTVLSRGFIAIIFLIMLIPFYFVYQSIVQKITLLHTYQDAFSSIKSKVTKSSIGRLQETAFYQRLAKQPASKVIEALEKYSLLTHEKHLIDVLNKEPALKDHLLSAEKKEILEEDACHLKFKLTHQNTKQGLAENYLELENVAYLNPEDLEVILTQLESSSHFSNQNPHIIVKRMFLEKMPITTTCEVFSLKMDLLTRTLIEGRPSKEEL